MTVSIADLISQRSMLVILIASCTSARATFDTADSVVDVQLREDLNRMIERSQCELEKLNRAIDQAASG